MRPPLQEHARVRASTAQVMVLLLIAWLRLDTAPTRAADRARDEQDAKPSSPAPSKTFQFRYVQSEFIDDPKVGKDPFYPNSTRRMPKEAPKPVVETPGGEAEAIFRELSLKGISGTAGKRLALINSRTFGVGESGELRVKGKLVKVRCLEIQDRSVVVSVEGYPQRRELKLRTDL